jgi:hypothetical protein
LKKHGKWALVIIIAGLLGAGIAQVGATVTAQSAALEQLTAAPAIATAPAAPSGGCKGGCKGPGNACAKSAATTTTDPAKQPTCGSGEGGCPEKEAGRECTDCSQHPNCAKNKASVCPMKAAGEKCSDCSTHKGCPMSTTTAPAKSPADAAKPAPK